MRRTIQLVDSLDQARAMRETFMDRESKREKRMPFTWPTDLQHIGQCIAIEYRSDKWHPREDEDYKHIAEAPQDILACRDFLCPWDAPRTPIETFGPMMPLAQPLPRHFAELPEVLGVQLRLYVAGGRKPRFGRGDEGYVQVRIPRCMLGGARHPKNGRAFLFLYNPDREDGVHAVITGSKLDIEKDGIVG